MKMIELTAFIISIILLTSCSGITYSKKEKIFIDAPYEKAKSICNAVYNNGLLYEIKLEFPEFNQNKDGFRLNWGKFSSFDSEAPARIFIEIITTSPQKEKNGPLFSFLKTKIIAQLESEKIPLLKNKIQK